MNYSERITIRDHIENILELVDHMKHLSNSLSSLSNEEWIERYSDIQQLDDEIQDCIMQLLESERE